MAVLVSEALSGTSDTTITGTVYEDLNSNGSRDSGEDGIAGWRVYLDLDQSGTWNTDAVGAQEPSAVTNGDGDFTIGNLKPGSYRLAEIVADGWTPTAPQSQDVTVVARRDTKTTFFNFAGGDIVGAVWNDVDHDGTRATDPDTGEFLEPGLAGWTVFLDQNANDTLDTGEPSTTTDSTGSYAFRELPPGDYEVAEVLPDGWDATKHFDTRQTVTVVALETSTQDFANFSDTNGSLEGTVWNDVNGNGLRDVDPDTGEFTEPGLADWTVILDLNEDGVFDATEPSVVTNVDGDYAFASLGAGRYDVMEVLPDGWTPAPGFDVAQSFTVVAGESTKGADFANFTTLNGSITGLVWNDVNRNGVRDVNTLSGEFTDPPLTGWTVFLDRNRDGALNDDEPSVLTDADGVYRFDDLQVGEYELREVVPTGWETAPTFAEDQSIVVYSGATSVATDFANYNASTSAPGSIAGIVWNDADSNGLHDSSETGLAGWTIFLDQNSDGALSTGEPNTVTAADGSYSFTNVTPGTVTVIAVGMTGWLATAPSTSSHTFAIRGAQDLTGIDFGVRERTDSGVHGVVFNDANHDGVRNAGERGLSGITVFLDVNSNGVFDTGEPSTVTSTDLFYTPSVDEAGAYSFTHLAKGSYSVRAMLPVELSATPAANREHSLTLVTGEERVIDFAVLYRPSEIHGTKYEDLNGNHQRDDGEPAMAGATVYLDLNRNNSLDDGEPATTTASDGAYSFTDLSPGAYVVREIVQAGYEQTSPTTVGGILWPSGVSHPAVGNVTPSSITVSLAKDEVHRETVSLTMPNTGALTNLVDVFLLFDDTGSFTYNSPIVRGAFPDIIASLQSSLPGIDLGFGVGRFEEYADFAWEYSTGRPFVLNQPIVAASTSGYLAAIQAALDRTTPGYGGDQPETDIEALYQLVTGAGFDGNNNGSSTDSGAAGLAATQLNPGNSGDVPAFSSFTADLANNVLPAAGTVGGGGFRAGALPIVLLATDTGFAYQPKGESVITGVGGQTLPLSSFTETSRPTTPFNSGAGIQETVTALNALGALVIGLGTNPEPTIDPRQGLEALSQLTGAINRSTSTIDNGTADPIAPGDPFYFEIASGFGASVASGVTNAIQNAVTNVAVDVTVQASDPRVRIVNHTGTLHNVGAGQTATFDIEFFGDGVPHRFDLQFVRAGTNVILGSIPVVIGTPVPGDGYEFEDLEEGEIHHSIDFSDRAAVVGTNHAPVATGDTYATNEDTTLVIAAAGVLANDSDADGDALTATLASNPSHGAVTLNADGSFAYTPAANFHGSDSFTYVANDGTDDSAAVTVHITVASVNDAPVGTGDTYSTNEDTTLVIAAAGVLANDSDTDGDTLTASLVSNPSHGAVTLNTDGSFVYTPAAGFHGSDAFTYLANDGTEDSAPVTVDITVDAVNDAPVAVDDIYSTDEDTLLSIVAAGVLANDSDADGDALTATLASNPSHGTVTLDVDGSFVYTPAANFHGSDSFTYVANDGTDDSAPVTVHITVASVNDAPVATGDAYSTDEDTTLTVVAAGVLANDNDADGDPLTATLVSHPSHGTAILNADGSFAYTPAANFHGSDSFTYVANDGAESSAPVTVNITVDSVNDSPAASDDAYSTNEDTALTVVAAGVLANDSDIDGDPLTASLVSNPSHGTVTLNADGSFTYNPAANFHGSDAFTYAANDGTDNSAPVTVNITVASVNDAPVATGDAYSMNENSTLTVDAAGVLVNDSDADGDSLTVSLVSNPSHGTVTLNANGSFTYTPAANFHGSDSFTYVANDGTDNSAPVTVDITIAATSQPQFLVVDDRVRQTFDYGFSGDFLVGQNLQRQNQAPRGLAANADGSMRWVVDSNDRVFVYNAAGQLLGAWKVQGIDKPEGIAVHGNDLWIVDRGASRIYYFANGASQLTGSLRPTSSFRLAAANRNAMDVTTDGVHLWVVDEGRVDQVFRYALDGRLEGSWRLDAANATPSGLAVDSQNPSSLFVVDAGTDRVYEYTDAASRVSGTQNAARSFALQARDRNPQGITLMKPAAAALRALGPTNDPSQGEGEGPSTTPSSASSVAAASTTPAASVSTETGSVRAAARRALRRAQHEAWDHALAEVTNELSWH